MNHRYARLLAYSIPALIIGLLLACGVGPSAVKGDVSTPSPPSTRAGLDAAPQTAPSQAAQGITYYVRADGGSPDECTGQADAAYPGSGTNQPCAWDHPFRALPPDDTPRISGGDTLLIKSGSYMMGYGAPGDDNCESDGAFDCHMPPIPSGPDASHPTRILGAGWDTGCTNPPELWGTQRPWYVVNLTGASNVELACLEITDHSGCVESHSGGLACQRDTYPFGEWADVGLYAEDSTNVHLQDLDIHGLASGGVLAGRLTDWTVENVRIAGNGWSGWDGDIDGDDSNSGTLTFRHWTVEWNGCAETYPGGQPAGCWGQTAGGYGDGVGTGATGGHWIIEDSAFLHNTSDGLDLLYAREAGSSIEIRRTIAEGNAGDQLKTTGPTVVENVIAVSNCGFFDGQSFTYNVDNCRAGGSAIALTLRASNQASIVNSTITGQGDCLLIAECMEGESCNGSESVLLRNDIFQGNPEFEQADTTCLAWYGTSHDPFAIDYAIINGVKNMPAPCPSNSLCDVSPGVTDGSITNFDAHLLSNSPAIDAGNDTACPATDYAGNARPVDGDGNGSAACDIGAYEYGGTVSPTLSAAFSATPLSGSPPLTVTFTNLSSGDYTTSLWNFGDGMSSTLPSPVHTYLTLGVYTVTLMVGGTAGSDTETKPGYIRVQEVTFYYTYLPVVQRNYASSTPANGECPAYAPSFTPVVGTQVHSVPEMAEPAARQWFTDPTFDTCLVRVTDRANDLSPGDSSTGLANEYARVQSFNADESRLLGRGTEGTWYLYDAQTLGPPLAELPLAVEPRWDADNPNLLYYSDETRLMSYDLQTEQHTLVHEFADDFPGQTVVAVWTRYEGRPSRDRRYWGLIAQDESWETVAFVVYDRQTDQVTIRDMRGVPEVADGIDHVTISPLGDYFLASFDHYCEYGELGDDENPCGLMVYDGDLTNGRGLLRIIGHYDPVLDAQGRQVIVYQDIDTDHISMLDLETGTVTALWEIDFSHTAIGLHFSGLAYDRPGWALVSTHDNDLTTYTWMDDQVFAVELQPGGRVVRLAHTHSLVNDELALDYWAEPHASVNASLTRIVFTTNWGRSGTGQVEMFMIALPSDWLERLP
jgi:PKD repeat protein